MYYFKQFSKLASTNINFSTKNFNYSKLKALFVYLARPFELFISSKKDIKKIQN